MQCPARKPVPPVTSTVTSVIAFRLPPGDARLLREPVRPLRAMTGVLVNIRRATRMTQPSRGQAEAETDADDAAVIQLSRHEPEYFTALFRRHAPYIQRYVVRRLGP